MKSSVGGEALVDCCKRKGHVWRCLLRVYSVFRDAGLEGGCRKAVVCFRGLETSQHSALRNRQGHNLARVHVTCDLSGEGRLAAPLSHALDVLEEIWFTCLLAAIGGRALDDSKRRVAMGGAAG